MQLILWDIFDTNSRLNDTLDNLCMYIVLLVLAYKPLQSIPTPEKLSSQSHSSMSVVRYLTNIQGCHPIVSSWW